MLGKGLESLIPPNQGKKPGDSGANTSPAPQNHNPEPPASLPVGPTEPIEDTLLPDALNPADELPVGEPPEELPPAEPVPSTAPEEKPQSSQPIIVPPPKEEPPVRYEPTDYPAARQHPKERSEAIFYLETAKIKPNEHQPRKHFDEEAIKELASSIREFGLLQPIVVTKKETEVPTGTEVEYELIAGERRLLAAKSLGMERIPAIIRHVDAERERLELAIIENLQRENLNGVEMARAFNRLQDEFRLTQREIAARLGKSRESVANTMRLLDLPTYIQEAIEKGMITDSHGLFLLGIDDPAVQQALFHDLVSQKLTIRELRQKARVMTHKAPAAHEAAGPEIKLFEEKLASELGAPVSIQQKGQSGKITIDFYSKEELENIIRRLGGEE